jgi:hypothetical protein
MHAAMKRPTLTFTFLCVAAYGAQIADCCALNKVGDAAVILMLDLVCLALFVGLAGWSLVSIRRHWIRAAAGVLVCAACVWQHIQNTKIIW